MSAYAATARIDRSSPHLVIGRSERYEGNARAASSPYDVVVDVAAADSADPLRDRLAAARERWSQLTFYLFDGDGWR
jgi:hypothetical protein